LAAVAAATPSGCGPGAGRKKRRPESDCKVALFIAVLAALQLVVSNAAFLHSSIGLIGVVDAWSPALAQVFSLVLALEQVCCKSAIALLLVVGAGRLVL
jgi:steroid 5-alpha reductase family enzyme